MIIMMMIIIIMMMTILIVIITRVKQRDLLYFCPDYDNDIQNSNEIDNHFQRKEDFFLHRFQQLRSYRGETELGTRKKFPSLHDLSKGTFSCRRTIDTPPQRRTFI